MIKISVITVCFNEIATIKRTVESVFSQTYKNIEYIVLDGGSNDGTDQYLSGIANQLCFYKSEKDKGIYDAMNKALLHCTGDLVYFLNANDYFFDSKVIERVVDTYTQSAYTEIFYGNVAYSAEPGVIHFRDNKYFEFFDLNDFYLRNRPQQCFFIKRELFETVGNFDERYKICGDFDWLVRAIVLKKKFLYVPINICVFDENGISGTETKKRLGEKRRSIIRLSPPPVLLKYFAQGIYMFLKSRISLRSTIDAS